MNFNWSQEETTLNNFGGDLVSLHVHKTGLPFFDALRLYGAIDLYIGLREDVEIRNRGNKWLIIGRTRRNRIEGRDLKVFVKLRNQRKPDPEEYCANLKSSLIAGEILPHDFLVHGRGEWDAALQDGVRGISARAYETLQSGQTSKTECKATVPLRDAILAAAGQKRIDIIGDVIFLPIFEGRLDLAKIVSPLRIQLRPPQIVPLQALALLMLKTSLFAEGYADNLKGVVFSTAFDSRKRENSSGFVSIESTAIGRIQSSQLVGHLYRVFAVLLSRAWSRGERVTRFYLPLMAMTFWVMQPLKQENLSQMVSSQEFLRRENLGQVFTNVDYVKGIFDMTHPELPDIDHEAVRKLAKAVSSAIYFARMAKQKEHEAKQKAWYDEVALLRSASSARAFRERALILLEQGHREHSQVGTAHRGEDYDPGALLSAIGDERGPRFEAFRDLFRMYLIQASTGGVKDAPSEANAPILENDSEQKLEVAE